jgi:hypothetical protein
METNLQMLNKFGLNLFIENCKLKLYFLFLYFACVLVQFGRTEGKNDESRDTRKILIVVTTAWNNHKQRRTTVYFVLLA